MTSSIINKNSLNTKSYNKIIFNIFYAEWMYGFISSQCLTANKGGGKMDFNVWRVILIGDGLAIRYFCAAWENELKSQPECFIRNK